MTRYFVRTLALALIGGALGALQVPSASAAPGIAPGAPAPGFQLPRPAADRWP